MANEHVAARMDLARRVTDRFVGAGAVAALVAGSTASGTCDEWSDIDLIVFYEEWPGRAAIEAGRSHLDPKEPVTIGGDLDGPVYLEQFWVDGIAVQVVHQTMAVWREQAATVLEKLDTASPAQKALSGLHEGAVLHGAGIIEGLRREAGYPAALRHAMVRANRDVFPLWRLQDSLTVRDAELWQRSELVAGLQKILGMLAGVNEVFFSTFQLKHMGDLVASLRHAPTNLASRIDAALVAPMPEAAAELERLVKETLAIVERELPEAESNR